MVTIQDVRENREDILRICREHGGSNVRLFGSVVRGEQTPVSDLDMLVELAENRSLLDRIAIKHAIEDLLHTTVDVVSPKALHQLIREEVLQEAVAL